MKLKYSKIPLAKENAFLKKGNTESQVIDKEKRTKNNGSWRRKFHEIGDGPMLKYYKKTEKKKVPDFANKVVIKRAVTKKRLQYSRYFDSKVIIIIFFSKVIIFKETEFKSTIHV